MYSYVVLFGWSFLAATIVPLGSEPALVVMIQRGHPLAAVVLIATLGNYLGACTTYGLGRAAARVLRPEASSRSVKRATDMVARYGAPALVLSWIPILGDAIVAAAGVAGMKFVPFSIWTILGKAGRYLAVAWGARAVLG